MSDEIQGESQETEDAETSEESSTEETDVVEGDESSAEEEEPKIPISRLRQETQKRREAEGNLSKLTERLEKLETTPTVTGDKEQEAKVYLKGLIKEELAAARNAEKSESEAASKVINETLGEIKDIYPDIAKNEKKFLDFVEKGNFEKGPDGIWGAAKIFSDVGKKTTEARKPKLPTGTKTSDTVLNTPEDDKDKSLYQIAREAIAEGKESGKA